MRKVILAVVVAGLMLSSVVSAEQKYIQVQVKYKKGEFKPRDTRTVDILAGFEKGRKIARSDYGGRMDKKVEATGFFYPKKIGDRWWLVDPEGNLFVHAGVASVYQGMTKLSKANTLKKFGTSQKWAEFTTAILFEHGFNGTGGWSEGVLLRGSPRPLAYTISLDFMRDFGKSMKLTHQKPGHTGYVNNVMPVLHPGFEAWCDEYAKKRVGARKDDKWLIGYFSDNELPIRREMLDKTLELADTNEPEMRLCYDAAKKWLDKRKGKEAGIEDVTDQDRAAFVEYAVDRYYRLTTAAIRKYDSNHLCLGSRLHGRATRYPEVFRAAGKYLDVISVNYYHAWSPDKKRVAMWNGESAKPVMITEWYAKGMDSGMKNIAGAGWTVLTQKDRGLFYQNFVIGLLETKGVVGWHWFKYRDNESDDPDVIEGNRSSNKGIVNYKYEPYKALLNEMKQLNEELYALIDHFDSR